MTIIKPTAMKYLDKFKAEIATCAVILRYPESQRFVISARCLDEMKYSCLNRRLSESEK
jgi:hypothetical protein